MQSPYPLEFEVSGKNVHDQQKFVQRFWSQFASCNEARHDLTAASSDEGSEGVKAI